MINDGTADFEKAFTQYFALFSIFKLKFSDKIKLTLEFVNNYIIKFKNHKSLININRRVLSFINKIRRSTE